MKIVVYTSVVGVRDPVRRDIPCFNEGKKFSSPRFAARFPKCCSHLFVDAEWSIWTDANIFLKVDPEELVGMLDGAHVGVWEHPWNSTVYEEAHEIMRKRLDTKENVMAGEPEKDRCRLAMTGIVVRRHISPVERANEAWWARVCAHSCRDQLSFPKCFDNLDVEYFPKLDSIDDNEYFTRKPHAGKSHYEKRK